MKNKKIFMRFFVLAGVLWVHSAFAATTQEYMEKGQQAYDTGDYKKAVEFFEKAVESDPNYAPSYNALGLAHMALKGPLNDVVWFFKVAVDIDPKYLEAYGNMCRVYYQATEYDLAQTACEKALEINPEYGQAQMSMAWIYLLGRSNPAESLRYFESVRRKIESPMVYFGMGLAYARQGDNARVLEMVTFLRSMNANDLASQLERDIRKNEMPPAPARSLEQVPQEPKQAGMIVPSQPSVSSGSSITSAGSGPVSGNMKVRLRGKLQNTLTTKDAPQHPGSL